MVWKREDAAANNWSLTFFSRSAHVSMCEASGAFCFLPTTLPLRHLFSHCFCIWTKLVRHKTDFFFLLQIKDYQFFQYHEIQCFVCCHVHWLEKKKCQCSHCWLFLWLMQPIKLDFMAGLPLKTVMSFVICVLNYFIHYLVLSVCSLSVKGQLNKVCHVECWAAQIAVTVSTCIKCSALIRSR